MVMGCYGIGITRIMAAAIEQNHDQWGIQWPVPLAPYEVAVLPLNGDDEAVVSVARSIYEELCERGIQVVLDDRAMRPGGKFKDADLIGFPFQVVVGKRGLAEGQVEIKTRKTNEKLKVAPGDAAEQVLGLVESARTVS